MEVKSEGPLCPDSDVAGILKFKFCEPYQIGGHQVQVIAVGTAIQHKLEFFQDVYGILQPPGEARSISTGT